MKVLLDLLVACVLGDSTMVLIMAALLVIAVTLVMIATRLAQGASGGTRRSAVELMVLITVTKELCAPESFGFVVQSRPGQTRSDLLELIRDELPARLREAAITYWSAEPNVITPARKTLSAPARPTDIQALTRASATNADPREIPASDATPLTRGGAR